MNDLLSTAVVNVARVALSNVLWLVDVVFGPTLVPRVCVVFGSFFDLEFMCFLGTTTIGILGRGAELVVGREQVPFVLVL